MIPVFWLSFNDTPARCRWDQDFLDVIAPPDRYRHLYGGEKVRFPGEGGVVVFPAGHNEQYVPHLNKFLALWEWVVLFLTSDEESTFPVHRITHPNIRIWLSTPRPDRHAKFDYRFFPLGYPLHETDSFRLIESAHEDVHDWFFHGQVTHQRRDDMVESMSPFPNGKAIPSPGFTQGMPRREYLHSMALSKVCPSPSGPTSPDCFRTWEALEAGAVPIVDQGPKPDSLGRAIDGYPPGFWELLLGDVPFPVLSDWKYGPAATRAILETYPAINNIIFSWWQLKKKTLRESLLRDVEELSGRAIQPRTINDLITVLVPTSPVPANPDYSHLSATIASIRDQLPTAEILLMIDGVRSEQYHLTSSYEEYQRRILWLTNHTWPNVIPIRFDDHMHQAEMTRRTLEFVGTPLVLFVEHDTPLVGDIEWDVCAAAVMDNQYDVIRFYPEKILQPEHEHLMGERNGIFQETVQWSQRPHLAWTDYYRRITHDHFEPGERAMIEDRMHSIAQSDPDDHLIAIYAPDGDVQRSYHLDARGEEPKWEFG